MERNRQKPVGQDKGSLTEQQIKGTATKVQIRRKHNTNSRNGQSHSHDRRCHALPSRERFPAAQLPPHWNPA